MSTGHILKSTKREIVKKNCPAVGDLLPADNEAHLFFGWIPHASRSFQQWLKRQGERRFQGLSHPFIVFVKKLQEWYFQLKTH
jgi:hypothetical protein